MAQEFYEFDDSAVEGALDAARGRHEENTALKVLTAQSPGSVGWQACGAGGAMHCRDGRDQQGLPEAAAWLWQTLLSAAGVDPRWHGGAGLPGYLHEIRNPHRSEGVHQRGGQHRVQRNLWRVLGLR